tara:strand:+ start:1757 stop:1939 length:183 start_codon:yes stop_codon:yes gene_type:complete
MQDSIITAANNCFIVFIYIFYTNGRRVNKDLPPLGFLLYWKFKTTMSQSQKMNEKLIFLI